VAKEAGGGAAGREPLSRERVLLGAVAVADAGGLASLTIRSLAHELGVKPMSVYHYVASKDEILDGIVDRVFGEIDLPSTEGDWRAELRRRAISARSVLRRHPWAIPLMQSRTHPGPATLRHHDSIIATLRGAGFSLEMTAHAYALMDSYVLGFALSEAALPINGPETVPELAGQMMQLFSPVDYPHLVEFTAGHVLKPGYDFGDEFEFGLTVVLDGLATSIPDSHNGPGRGRRPPRRRPTGSSLGS
jgi:AcrR family transcriptional regulator